MIYPGAVKAWNIAPSIGVTEYYTDNVTRVSAGNEMSEYITAVNPGIVIERHGPKSELLMDYQLQALSYKENSDQNNNHHKLNLDFSSELASDLLFLDLVGVYEQQSIDPSTISDPARTNLFLSSNQTDVAMLEITPYFKKTVSNTSSMLLRPSFGKTQYKDAAEANNDIVQVIALAEQKPTQQFMGWNISTQQRFVAYENGEKMQLRRLDYGLDIPIGLRMTWLLSGGREINKFEYTNFTTNINDTIFGTGLRWEVGSSTSLSLAYENRFFGNTYLLQFDHRTRYSQWSLDYKEDLETNSLRLQPLLGPDQAQGKDVTTTLGELNNIDNGVYIYKRLNLSETWLQGRSEISWRIFRESRVMQDTYNEQIQSMASIELARNIAGRSRLSFLIVRQKNNYSENDREEYTSEYKATMSHNYSSNSVGFVEYKHSTLDSNEDVRDYRANLYNIGVTVKF